MISIKHRFTGAVLCAVDVDTVHEAVIKSVKSRANLSGADLYGANLYGANLSRADLSGADLSGADLYGANLYGANLSGADLYGANLYGANLSGADLSRANLSRADLSGADLYGANLYGANLSRADLSGANLSRADLSGANLYGEKLAIAPVQIQTDIWSVLISETFMKIGCERHTHDKWRSFDEKTISKMESRALDWWKQWKEPLLDICRLHRKQSLAYRKSNPEKFAEES